MKKADIENLINEISEPILETLDFALVDVEYVKEGTNMFLRIYIDKPDGVTIDDCQKFSEALSIKLDEVDPIEDNYFLEVSSPGLDRPLKNDEDLENNLNKDVEVGLYKAIDGRKKFIGQLIGYDSDKIKIIDESNGEMALDRSLIAKINLAVKF